jgi:hypothetical protein
MISVLPPEILSNIISLLWTVPAESPSSPGQSPSSSSDSVASLKVLHAAAHADGSQATEGAVQTGVALAGQSQHYGLAAAAAAAADESEPPTLVRQRSILAYFAISSAAAAVDDEDQTIDSSNFEP